MKILFFGQLRELLNVTELQLDATPSDVSALLEHLSAQNDQWRQYLSSDSILVAVNQTLSDKHCKLNEHDEVAFFPPVTGG
ncbi:MAG: molybdopterin synthase sulfur carrier subunit [Aliiglaciecola sp.]|uniref:molybdopterin converting factor subunit 1 n=1 Tax=Aliiglaciecola sp. M165 TaxID=2593649 RepID=UPI00117E17C3|nr:molybdopterin converting factor subunit 1 [Aliiglaciecola sp. M165]TRY30199.1 molybdopterin converting factor subunit 1 [Aliiglaciecola sp. M165]